MINSIPASVITTANPEILADQELLADRAREQFHRAPVEKTINARPLDARTTGYEGGNSALAGGSGFLNTAKHMIKGAMSDFRHGLQDSLQDLGFKGGLATELTQEVLDATRDALTYGADFSINLMVAAVSQSMSVSAAGTSSSFSMMASSVEINVNHTTGSITVSTTSVSIEGQTTNGYGAAPPLLLDMLDSERFRAQDLTSELLALQDFTDITVDEDAPDAILNQAQKDAQIQAVRELAEIEADVAEIKTPRVVSRPDSNARVFVTALRHEVNDREEKITIIRFDAMVPLSRSGSPPSASSLPVTAETLRAEASKANDVSLMV
ncbi:MAG: hypothetical protein ACI9MJ_002533 [Alphaproteobacteria bacterium]|jgi:hypothetical protein